MTIHTNKQPRYAAMPAVLALALVTFTGASVVTDVALAKPYQITGVRNNNVAFISNEALKSKCKKAGGSFTSKKDKNGHTYTCSVNRKDGGYTIVGCNKKGWFGGNCGGITTNPK